MWLFLQVMISLKISYRIVRRSGTRLFLTAFVMIGAYDWLICFSFSRGDKLVGGVRRELHTLALQVPIMQEEGLRDAFLSRLGTV